ncbi:hypothetical protein QCA50_019816 [Cerrena zonata]|uniref:BTB domain-containing protein n=1 Tax=Cerrena zonata TaxID=2478898 RepID=A0AAW0FDI3_9APHY
MPAQRSIAQSPFDNTLANIVLRSCDNIDFYVYKEVLIIASPFFATLFSLPQPPPDSSSDPTPAAADERSPEGLHIICVPEESEVLDYILRICYPLRNPTPLTSLTLIEKVVIATQKYEIDVALDVARADLTRMGAKSPVWMYMLSCSHYLENEAKIAADLLRHKYYPQNRKAPLPGDSAFVRIALEIYDDNYGQLPAILLYRLVRHICFGEGKTFCNLSDSSSTEPQSGNSQDSDAPPTGSIFLGFVALLVEHPADILLKSSDGVIIPAHKLILRLASATSILSRLDESDCVRQDGIPVVTLEHSADALTQLIYACYPHPSNSPSKYQPDDDLRLFHVAQSYDMSDIASKARSRWSAQAKLTKDPLSTYLLTSQNGWTDEAQDAARQLASSRISISAKYVLEMERAGTAKHYHALLKLYDNIFVLSRTYISNEVASQRNRWDISGEAWHDPSYAITPSIAPIVAFDALCNHQCYLRRSHSRQFIEICDPPYPPAGGDIETHPDPPPLSIGRMVDNSRKLYNKFMEDVTHAQL